MTRPHSGCTVPLCRRKGEPSHTPKRGNGHDPIPDHAGSAHLWEKTGMTRPHSGCTVPLCRRKGEPSHTPKRGNGHDPIPDHAGSAHF